MTCVPNVTLNSSPEHGQRVDGGGDLHDDTSHECKQLGNRTRTERSCCVRDRPCAVVADELAPC